ncbi:MAG: insulinase family protein [Acidobacteriota bacterium]
MSSRFSEHFHLNVRKHRLPNGLTVLLYEDHRLPQVAVNVWYHVGSKDEVPGKTGFAHLFEHMMFQGSEHFPDDYFKPLEEIGARLNGSTSEDRTNYWEVVPSAYLERALWMEADRMGYLLPAVDQPKLDNQRDVVKNERRQTLENEPYGISEEILPPILFPRNHPYHHSVIGSMEDLDSATLEDVKDFFRKYYAPNNASLCVAGDMDPDRALSLVNTYFSGIPSGPVVSPVEPWLPALSRPERAEATDRVQLPRLYLAWPTPRQFTPDDAALAVLGSILSVGRDSRLVKRLQLDSDLAQSVGAFQMSGEVCSTFMAILTAQPGRSIDALEDATWEELNRISEDGVTEFELKASIDSLRARMTKRLQVVGGFGGISDILNHYQTFRDDPGALVRDLERLEALTPDAIRDAARTWLPYSGHAAVKITPAAEQKDALDRSVMPGPEGEGVFRFPEMERRTLGNGLEVWVLPQSGLPYVTVQATIRAGASSDPDDLPGLAEFTANLMDEGAAGLGTLELSRRFKELATSLAVDVNRDDATFTMGLLTEHFQGGVSLLADVLLRPDFHEPDMERRRREHLADLVRSLDVRTGRTARPAVSLRIPNGPGKRVSTSWTNRARPSPISRWEFRPSNERTKAIPPSWSSTRFWAASSPAGST